jgi:tetrahydromethanopterin S-methyltransferase subunit F
MDNNEIIKIGKSISSYNNSNKKKDIIVHDSTIMRYIGIESYCRFQKEEPNLYEEFLECNNVIDNLPTQLNIELMDSQLTNEDIKKQLVTLIANPNSNSVSQTVKNIKYHSESFPGEILLQHPSATIWFIIIIFIIIFLIILVLYMLGVVDLLIKPQNQINQPKFTIFI